MLMLVTADNLVQMFFGWEGVGLASYLLIGFWFRKPSANAAAIKAFVVNRVGDLGFMLGIFGTYLVFHTISIPEILRLAPGMAGSTIGFVGYRIDTMTLLCLLLFVGAMGKSSLACTPLPDAMEGPTPVWRSSTPRPWSPQACSWFADCRRCSRPRLLRWGSSPSSVRHLHFRRYRRHDAVDIKRASPIRPVRAGYMFFAAAWALMARRCSTSLRTPSSRRCCSSVRGRSSMRCITNRTCAITANCGNTSR